MDRREFLRTLGLAAPIVVAAPTYFFAPIGGWHSDVILSAYNSTALSPYEFMRLERNDGIGKMLRGTFPSRKLSGGREIFFIR